MRGLTTLLAALAWLGCSVLNGLSDPPGAGDDGGGGGAGDGGGDGAGGRPDAPCVDAADQRLALAPATIQLMVDRSGSMSDQLGATGVTQWQAALQAIATTVAEAAHTVRFGATGFSGAGTATCPDLVTVAPAPDNTEAITNSLAAQDPNYVSPSEAFQPLIDALATDPGRPRSIVLMTDDPPHLCATPTTDSTAQAVAALQNGFAGGITTRVIRIDVDDPDPSPFQRMANAGAGQPDGATTPYATITTYDELVLALREAFVELGPCRFPLTDPPANPEAAQVSLDGAILAYGEDWTLANDAILLGESACLALRASPTLELVVRRPCG